MSKKDREIELNAEVIEAMRDARFRVKLETGMEIMAYASGDIRKNRIRIVVGDKVMVKMPVDSYELGRIVYRFK